MPEAAPLPAIVFAKLQGNRQMTLGGPSGLETSRWVFDCHALDYESAESLAIIVRDVLETFTGTLPDGSKILDAKQVGELQVFEEAPLTYTVPLEVLILGGDA